MHVWPMHVWSLRRSARRPAWSRCVAASTLLVAVALGMAGCAAPPPATAQMDAGAARGGGYGTVAAMRPPGGAGDTRRSILAALGQPDRPADGRVEYIVRGDDGQPVSVMQAPDDRLRAGTRVAMIPGARLRIAPLAVAQAAP